MEELYFPVFIKISGKKIIVFGAGNIACRRVRVLCNFGADITVVAPNLHQEIINMKQRFIDNITLKNGVYKNGMIDEYDLVFSAVDDINVDQAIYQECREKKIPVNIASDRTLCDFYFPAVVKEEDMVIGVSSGGRDHKKVKKTAGLIRNLLKKGDNHYD